MEPYQNQIPPTENVPTPRKHWYEFTPKTKYGLIPLVPALIMAGITLYIQIHSFLFYTLFSSDGIVGLRVLGWLYNLPQTIAYIPVAILSRGMGDEALGLAILVELATPLLAFIFWYIVFLCLLWLTRKITSFKFVPYVVTSLVLLVLIIPLFVFTSSSASSIRVQACLSGKLNNDIGIGITGPDSCLEQILFGSLGSIQANSQSDSTKLIQFCTELSSKETVPSPGNEGIYFPTGATHQEFCIFTLGRSIIPRVSQAGINPLSVDFHQKYITEIPLPKRAPNDPRLRLDQDFSTLDKIYKSKLCRVFGSLTTPEEENRCSYFFSEEEKFNLQKSGPRETRSSLKVETALTATSSNDTLVFQKAPVSNDLALINLDRAKKDLAERYNIPESNFTVIDSEQIFLLKNDAAFDSGFSPLVLKNNYSATQGQVIVSGQKINMEARPKSPAVLLLNTVSQSAIALEARFTNQESSVFTAWVGDNKVFNIYDSNYRQPNKKIFIIPVSSAEKVSLEFFTYSTTGKSTMELSNIRVGDFKKAKNALESLGYRVTFKNTQTNTAVDVFLDETGYRVDYKGANPNDSNL